MSVLIVDDDPGRRVALTATVERLPIDVVSVGSGEEALRQIERRSFAVVLLDVSMPGMDGLTAAAHIRSMAAGRDLPILFVTAATPDELSDAPAYAMGAADYIYSPIRPEVLRSKVSVFIRLAEALNEARRATGRQQEFIDGAAHELRTPLAVISGYVSLIADGDLRPGATAWDHTMKVLVAKITELRQTVDDLLMSTRIDGEGVGAHSIPVDLSAEVEQAVARARGRSSLLDATITTDRGLGDMVALADPAHLAKILDNLINNALTYSRSAPVIKIRVRGADDPLIEIGDSGEGIASELHTDIFRKLFRASAKPGSGLGLYISRALADEMGAALVLDSSSPGRGSTFTLHLKPAAAISLN